MLGGILVIVIIILFFVAVMIASQKGALDYKLTGNKSEKDWLTTLLLCIFTGGLGIHRFYVGKIGTGLLFLFTLGCFGIGIIIDLIAIVMGKFADAEGNLIINENSSNNNISQADELKKYKELLDAGAITQEEYETKKKQLLNL